MLPGGVNVALLPPLKKWCRDSVVPMKHARSVASSTIYRSTITELPLDSCIRYKFIHYLIHTKIHSVNRVRSANKYYSAINIKLDSFLVNSLLVFRFLFHRIVDVCLSDSLNPALIFIYCASKTLFFIPSTSLAFAQLLSTQCLFLTFLKHHYVRSRKRMCRR